MLPQLANIQISFTLTLTDILVILAVMSGSVLLVCIFRFLWRLISWQTPPRTEGWWKVSLVSLLVFVVDLLILLFVYLFG